MAAQNEIPYGRLTPESLASMMSKYGYTSANALQAATGVQRSRILDHLHGKHPLGYAARMKLAKIFHSRRDLLTLFLP